MLRVSPQLWTAFFLLLICSCRLPLAICRSITHGSQTHLETEKNFLDHLWWFAFMKCSWSGEKKEMETLEYQCLNIIVLASECVFLRVCPVQRVLPVWGKSLFSWVESLMGRTRETTLSPLAGSHSYLGTGPLESIHLGFLCFLSNKRSLIVSPWHVLWQGLPL